MNTLPSLTWSERDKTATRYKIPKVTKKPIIDYEKLRALCDFAEMKDSELVPCEEDAHTSFMNRYKSVLVCESPKLGLPIHSLARSAQKSSQVTASRDTLDSIAGCKSTHSLYAAGKSPDKATPSETPSHNIGDHIRLLHKNRLREDQKSLGPQRLQDIQQIVRKLPFERSATENDNMYSLLRHIPGLKQNLRPAVLRELCALAKLESWSEDNITIFGNTGLHLILRGRVRPLSEPYVKDVGSDITFRSPTPDLEQTPAELCAGAWFGTLERVTDRTANSRILAVTTTDAGCEFLKISATDYEKVVEQLKNKDIAEKIQLLQACKTFSAWSRQPLQKVASLIKWVSFPANTVIASEGFESPFVAVLGAGECHVLRQLEVRHTKANGKQEKRLKQVVMATLNKYDSFGEHSVISKEPMTCSIVSASSVQLACITTERMTELDDVTKQLLLQSSEKTYDHVTQLAIDEEYVKQELKREWNETKHRIVMDTINARGIRPGFGKWAK